ncbi:hypothetical protein [Streptomyces goshikiensis]|uniref:hypothetical protein n=1 Tax=Streptomyces goshikiensis TaxID=1942 RepID=UPI0036696443
MITTEETTQLLAGTCVLSRINRHRYETRTVSTRSAHDRHLAVAQYYPPQGDSQTVTGWIVSGASSDHYSEPISNQEEALELLRQVTRAELFLSRCYRSLYPQIPLVAHDNIRRHKPSMRRLNQPH